MITLLPLRSLKKLSAIILVWAGLSAGAQTPQWDWAKGVGSNSQDDVTPVMVDSAGNVYEVINVPGNKITIGSYTFTNPHPETGPTSPSNPINVFVKYDKQGNVLAAKLFTGSINYITPQGYGYAFSEYLNPDTFKLGNLSVVDTSLNGNNRGLIIARYDPSGNLLSLKERATHSIGYAKFINFDSGHILALGSCSSADTIDQVPVSIGSFIAILDTNGAITRFRSLGYDSTYYTPDGTHYVYGGPTDLSLGGLCTNSKNNVYLQMALGSRAYLDAGVPIPNITSLINKSLFVKFDSALNYQWYRTGNTSGLIATDRFDNLFIACSGGTGAPDTLRIADLTLVLPYTPGSQAEYFGIVKLDGNGNGQWIDTFYNAGNYGAIISSLFTDQLGNVYAGGRDDSYISAGTYTLTGYGNLFVLKVNSNGEVKWLQGTQNSQGHIGPHCTFTEDGHGNIYSTGLYFYNSSPVFGADTLKGNTPINGYPQAPDVFTAKLGNCNPIPPTLSASSPLSWCGDDSVQLTSTSANTYLWNTADTAQTTTIRQSGVYAVYAIDTLGCYAQSKPDTIKNYPQPVLQLSTLQNGGTEITTATTTGGTPGYNYLWNDSLTGDTITNVHTGWYYAMVTDTNGCTASDSVFVPLITSAKSLSGENTISIYPNPTINSFYIETPMDGELKIYNAIGELAQQQIIASGRTRVENTTLSKGIYLLEIVSAIGKYSNKLIIQ